jgi:hypothetical protein
MPEDNPLNRLLARDQIITEFREKIASLKTQNSEALERDVLMALWSDLGDKTETYWQAMSAAGCLVEAHEAVNTAIGKIGSRRLRQRLVKALVELLTGQERITDQVEELAAERDRKLSALK